MNHHCHIFTSRWCSSYASGHDLGTLPLLQCPVCRDHGIVATVRSDHGIVATGSSLAGSHALLGTLCATR